MLHDIGKSKTVGPVPFADEDYKRRGNETASSAFFHSSDVMFVYLLNSRLLLAPVPRNECPLPCTKGSAIGIKSEVRNEGSNEERQA